MIGSEIAGGNWEDIRRLIQWFAFLVKGKCKVFLTRTTDPGFFGGKKDDSGKEPQGRKFLAEAQDKDDQFEVVYKEFMNSHGVMLEGVENERYDAEKEMKIDLATIEHFGHSVYKKAQKAAREARFAQRSS